jgi:hypothetical protein
MVLHVDGTTPPQAPALPEYLKAHVYLPPNLLTEFNDSHKTIANIVQSFIETLGVPTVLRWRRAATNNNWSLTQPGGRPVPSASNLPLIPDPVTPSSSYYVFPGRPYGPVPNVHQPPQPHPSPLIETQNEDAQLDWQTLAEQNAQLLEQLAQARAKETEYEATISRLNRQIQSIAVRQDRRVDDEVPVRADDSAVRGLGRLQTNTERSAPSVAYSRSFPLPSATALYRQPPSSSPVREISTIRSIYPSIAPSHIPSTPSRPRLRSNQVRFPGVLGTPSSSHPPITASYGGLRSFGVQCERFIEDHNLGDRLHRQLHDLYESTLATKWYQEIFKWFEAYDEVEELTEGLYRAFCEDVDTLH